MIPVTRPVPRLRSCSCGCWEASWSRQALPRRRSPCPGRGACTSRQIVDLTRADRVRGPADRGPVGGRRRPADGRQVAAGACGAVADGSGAGSACGFAGGGSWSTVAAATPCLSLRHAVDASVALVDAAIGRAALDGGDPERARARFGSALAYWHGEAFEDWRDAGWARGERQRLAEVKAAILKARIDTDLESGRHRDLVPELEGLVAAEPLHEGWWARLMLALYRSGRQGTRWQWLVARPDGRPRISGSIRARSWPRWKQSILAQAESLTPAAAPRRQRTADPPNGSEAAGSASRGCPYRGLAVVTSRVRRRPTSRWGGGLDTGGLCGEHGVTSTA